jgi:GTP:adenosylcobinamide-phosphate guanylyltransferase
MKAMVLAAGLGTRLRPLTYALPKPMVPVLDRPVMAHIVDLLDRHGCEEVIANLHYFPDTIRDYFGDRLTYREEEELLGTAGGVRNCADFLTNDGPFLVISGDALTDIDLTAFVARHKAAGGSRTRASTGSSCTTPRAASPAFRRSPTRRRRCPTSATAASTCSSARSSTTSRSSRSSTGRTTSSRHCWRTTSRSTSTRSTSTGTTSARSTSSRPARSTRCAVSSSSTSRASGWRRA